MHELKTFILLHLVGSLLNFIDLTKPSKEAYYERCKIICRFNYLSTINC